MSYGIDCRAQWTDPIMGRTFFCTVDTPHEDHEAGQCGTMPPVVVWRDDGTVVDVPGYRFDVALAEYLAVQDGYFLGAL